MLADLLLAFHIIVGALALALGPLALVTAAGVQLAGAYHAAVLAVCASALVLVALDVSGLWWLAPVAAGSYALALAGRLAAGRQGPGWERVRVHGQGGSYVALVTALLVVSIGSPLAWVAPTLIGAPLISLVLRRRLARKASAPTGPTLSSSLPNA